jgi:hypothetical protein
MHDSMKYITVDIPGLPGEWRMRESFPNGLDAAGHLNNIAYYSCGQWQRGITTEKVQYWVRVDEGRDKAEASRETNTSPACQQTKKQTIDSLFHDEETTV